MSNITPEVLLEKLVALFHEQNTLSEDMKALVDEAKEAGIQNVAAIKQAAKLKADQKEADWIEKTESVRKILEAEEV